MPEIERAEAAAIRGVTVDTWSSYVSRGQAPQPVRYVGRTPLWSEAEVRDHTANLPGRGARTTPRARRRAQERRGDG